MVKPVGLMEFCSANCH